MTRFIKVFLTTCFMTLVWATAQTFPVSVAHKYGTTTIESQPGRIVMLGFNDQDALYAVGARPVAVRHWFQNHPHDVFPWAQAAAGDASPAILGVGELDFETILSYDPDLIIGQFIGLTQAEYERLSQIAPTVAQSADYADYETPWQEMTRMVGKAVGQADAANQAVGEVEAAFAQAKADHPEFAGQTVAVALPNPDGGYWLYASNDNRGRAFAAMGFSIPAEVDEAAGKQSYVDVSEERLDLLDQDVLVILESDEHPVPDLDTWLNDPLFQSLEVVKDGQMLQLKGEAANALVFNTVLSLPYALDAMLPELAAMLKQGGV